VKRAAFALLLTAVVAVPAHADFNDIARALDAQDGVKKTWIPFLGLARVVVRSVHPEGVHDFQLAVFEGGEHLDPEKVKAQMARLAGPGYVPVVRAWSKKRGEFSFVYMRPRNDDDTVEMLVLAHDDEETALVRVVVDTEAIARHITVPEDVSRNIARTARR
jgi:hypothetical protein